MPGYGTLVYGAGPYGGGSGGISASDGFSISDSATRQVQSARTVTEGWAVSDSASGVWGFDPNGFDSLAISDSVSDTRSLPRGPSDSWTVGDVAKGVHIPYIDQPTHLALKGNVGSLDLRPGDSMTLSPGAATLELQSGAATNTLNAELRGLTLKDERRGLWTDG